MRKTYNTKPKPVKNCGGKKSKGGCANWAGATTVKTKIKIAA